MTTIRQDDFIASIADAFQYISIYHPLDYITALGHAWEREESPAAKDAIAQILTNSRMCAEGRRPICQDTGIAVVFLKIGMNVKWDTKLSVQEMVDEGVRQAYNHPDNKLRASVLLDPAGKRTNSRDNTPAVVHYEIVPGDHVEVICAAKGGGSENKSKMVMLNPSDSIVDWVLKTLPTMGAGWCPPGILGLGIGGTPEKAMLLAKESLMAPVDMHELLARGASNRIEELRLELYDKVNALGIGAQGLGGLTTVLDVKIMDYPTHAASLPVAMIPNCAATRHVHFHLDGSGPAKLDPPKLEDWPAVTWQADEKQATRVQLDTLTKGQVAAWKPGQVLLLNGRMLTGRDAAHKRIHDMLAKGEKLPVDFTDRIIYYVGPVDPVRDEVVGPAGPTTATRMDKFTRMMLEKTGLIAMVGKAERGPVAIDAIKDNRAAYLMAVGGAAYLVSKAIKSSRVVAFADLGMEAIYEFDVVDMPVTVAVDSAGTSVHQTGPHEWQVKIGKIPVAKH
ncbi:fumarate hydratase [Sulfurisoma sediminicola]|uniref:Fumarate hydratase class I n=1 Tax=Sulfurisoma sediminicola TaxID=1381557 RepID=A0A497XDQ2_9PROT|nr:fumarate hydratase [Sulfurisoma sediminicola]RLJ65101.1 homodimeric fumarase (class I) [Sulfurisoma sediminicola]